MKRRFTFALTALLGAACGGDTFDTGVDEGKSVGSVSPDEASRICEAIAGYTRDKLREPSCRLAGIAAFTVAALNPTAADAELQGACRKAYDDCSAPEATAPMSPSCNPPPGSCTATVGELEACVGDLGQEVDKALDVLPACNALSRASLRGGDMQRPPAVADPASCQSFRTKCPGAALPRL